MLLRNFNVVLIFDTLNIFIYSIAPLALLYSSLLFDGKILSLTGLKESSDFSDSYLLILNSKKNKNIASKNSAGNATSYKISIDINISLVDPINNEKIIRSKVFNSSFTYNDNQNKFELSQDEKNILNNLIEAASKKIVMYLSL